MSILYNVPIYLCSVIKLVLAIERPFAVKFCADTITCRPKNFPKYDRNTLVVKRNHFAQVGHLTTETRELGINSEFLCILCYSSSCKNRSLRSFIDPKTYRFSLLSLSASQNMKSRSTYVCNGKTSGDKTIRF